jgi:hypothetical protein
MGSRGGTRGPDAATVPKHTGTYTDRDHDHDHDRDHDRDHDHDHDRDLDHLQKHRLRLLE